MGEKKLPKRYAPRGLSEKALRVWRGVTDGFTLREDEYELLESACREIDLIDSIQKAIDRDGLMLTGSMGQPVAHPLLAELRQHRNVLRGMFAALKIPDGAVGDAAAEAGKVSSAARAAAQSRWSQSYGSA